MQSYFGSLHINLESMNPRADGLIHDLDSDTYDLYEIKASPRLRRITYQTLRSSQLWSGRQYNYRIRELVLLNDKYVRGDEIDIEQLFSVPNVTDEVREMTRDIEGKMRDALSVINQIVMTKYLIA